VKQFQRLSSALQVSGKKRTPTKKLIKTTNKKKGAALCMLPLNSVAQAVCVAAVVPIALYPAMKRVTYWPQVFLGLTFNLGALVGFASVAGNISPAGLLLYAGSVTWTTGYDTIYGHQDKQDDKQLGLKSTSLWDTNNRLPVTCAVASAVLWCVLHSLFVLFILKQCVGKKVCFSWCSL
jgi:4-hydroxybenzoate polyprenyltransferase